MKQRRRRLRSWAVFTTFPFFALWAGALTSCDRSPEETTLPSSSAAVLFRERVSATTELLHRADGTTTAAISLGPRGYLDDDGTWKDIIPALAPTERGGLAMERNLVRARFPRVLGADEPVRIEERRSGFGFSWRPMPSQGRSEPVRAQGAWALYELAEPGCVEEFQVLRGGLKHNLILSSPEAAQRTLRRVTEGVRASEGQLQLDPEIRLEARGEALDVVGPQGALFVLPAPSAYEVGRPTVSTRARYRWNAATGVLAVEVDEAWLLAPERQYPVAVDPPATVLSSYSAQVVGSGPTGPGSLVAGPNALSLGRIGGEYSQLALKFDVRALPPSTTVTSVALNVFFAASGSGGSYDIHLARLTVDPQTTEAGALFADGVHLAQPDYATITGQTLNCGCWINGGNPLTQSGTSLGATGVADLQNALSRGSFFLGMHVPSYSNNRYAVPHGMFDPNEPELYVDFTTGAPTVTRVSPSSASAGSSVNALVRGTGFRGQAGTTVALTPVGGGASTVVTVSYVSASEVQIAIPGSLAAGVYDVLATTSGGTSASSPAARFTVTTLKTWNGSASSSWSAAANWTPAGVPTPSSLVVVPSSTPPCNLDASASVHALQLTGGQLSTLGNSLTVAQDISVESGTLTMGSGTLYVGGHFFQGGGTFNAGTGTVEFNNPAPGRRTVLSRGRVLADDFESPSPPWSSTTTGAAFPWTVQSKYSVSPSQAYYQQGNQTSAGVARLTPLSPFSLVGRSTATLRWKHRFRINLADGVGPEAADGYVVEVSTNNGATWTSIAPSSTSVAPSAPKLLSGLCSGTGSHTGNTVTPAPGGLFAGEQPAWVQESVDLTPYVGNASVLIRFAVGWDNCNDFSPYEGVYIDDVLVTADEGQLGFNHLRLSDQAQVASYAQLQLGGNLDLSTAVNQLALGGAGLSANGNVTNAGILDRGPGGNFYVGGTFTNGGTFYAGTGSVTVGPLVNGGTFLGDIGTLTAASVNNAGTFRSGDNTVTVNGDLSNGGAFHARGSSLTVAGNLSNSGAIDVGTATLALTGSGATTVSGGGGYRQSAFRAAVFYDGFESGNFTTGGWVRTAGSTPPDSQVVNTPPGVGSRVANLAAGDQWLDNWITKAVSTSGRYGIFLSYGRATSTAAGTYGFDAEYSTNGGATWKRAQSIAGQFTYVTDSINLSALDPAVDNNPNFQFRFHSFTGQIGNYVYVDEVRLESGTDGVGHLSISGGGTKTLQPSNATNTFQVGGALNLAAGTLRVAGGKTLAIDNVSAFSSSSSAGTTLDIEPGARLALSGNTSLTIRGLLELLGTSASPSSVTSTDVVTPGRYALTVTGSFRGQYFDIDYANAQGLNLAAGCQVLQLDDGTFHRPPAAGALLTLGATALPSASTNCQFLNESGVNGAVSVNGSLNPSPLRFEFASGPLAGEPFDLDFGGQTPGNIVWGPTALVFTSPPRTAGAGVCTSISVAVRDPSDSPTTVAQALLLGLASSSTGNTFYADSGCTSTTTSATIGAGADAVTFYFRDTRLGTPTITVSAPGFTSIDQVQTIVPGPAAVLAFTASPASGTAGAPLSPLQVEVRDAVGNRVDSSTASITLTLGNNPTGATLSGGGPQAAVAGIASFAAASLNRTGNGYTLVASSTGLASETSGPFDVGPGPAAAVVFTTVAQTVQAGDCSAVATVEVRDALGNPSPTAGTLTLSASSATLGFFAASDATCALALAPSVLLDGSVATASFRFRDVTPGNPSLTVAPSFAASSAVQVQTITPAPASSLVFLSAAPQLSAGACSGPIQLEVRNTLGQSAAVGTSTPISLSTTSANGGFFTDVNCQTATPSTTVPAGQAQASPVYYRDTTAGAPTLTASATNLTSATQVARIDPGAAAVLRVAGFPSPIARGVAGAFTVTAHDAFGNVATSYQGTVRFFSTDSAAQRPPDYSFTAADMGTRGFFATLNTVGVHELEATDLANASVTGKQVGIQVDPGPAAALRVSGITSPTQVGAPHDVTVEVVDTAGNRVTGFTGTVQFQSTDATAVLPPSFAFTPADAGLHLFTAALSFGSPGTFDVTVVVVGNAAVRGTQSGIVVAPAPGPVILEDANLRAAVNVPYRYNASGSVRAVGTPPLLYERCGGPAGFQVDAASGAVRWTPAAPGSTALCVRVSNPEGEDRYELAVDVASGAAPSPVVAAFTATPTTGPAALTVAYDASASKGDPSALPLLFHWRFGDGSSPGEGVATSRRFLLAGGYRTVLTAFDTLGAGPPPPPRCSR
ncbi:MAG: hypothetical protein ACOZIN_15905 [Myxococcota bacterium]